MTPPRRRVILMRHGAVQYFDPAAPAPLAAHGVPLTAEGLAQARTAGLALAGAGVRIDLAIASGLPRTLQTADAVLGAQSQAVEVETWPELEEARGGRLRDLPADQLHAEFTALQRGPLTDDTRFLGGERLGDLLDRVLPAWERLRARRDWDTALVVAHGVVNAALLSHVVSGGQRLLLPGWQQNPACLNLIDLGTATGDDVLRGANLNPTDWLQRDERATTMERLREDFSQWQAARHALHRVTP